MTSSARFKDEIKPIKEASEVIYDLRPVSAYHFSSAMWSQYLGATLYFSALERGSFSLLLPRMGFSLLLTF